MKIESGKWSLGSAEDERNRDSKNHQLSGEPKHSVAFGTPFSEPPTVLVGVSGFAAGFGSPEFVVTAKNVTGKGCELVCGPARASFSQLHVFWLAYGA